MSNFLPVTASSWSRERRRGRQCQLKMYFSFSSSLYDQMSEMSNSRNSSGTQKDVYTVDFYGSYVCWWRRWAETVHSWHFILTHDIRECQGGRKEPLQTWELNNQIKQRQKRLWTGVKCHDDSKNRNHRKLSQSQLFQIFATMGMRVVVLLLKVVVLLLKVGQKAERKLVVTQEKLLFWLWRPTSTRRSNAEKRKHVHAIQDQNIYQYLMTYILLKANV